MWKNYKIFTADNSPGFRTFASYAITETDHEGL